MKLITAVVTPFRLDEIRNALADAGIAGMTISEVKGFGRQRGHKELYRGAEYIIDFQPKITLEIAVSDSAADAAIDAVMGAARSGRIGDGKVFVRDLDEAYRIRTGESSEAAI